MQYKDTIYNNYLLNHTKWLYGQESLKHIALQFPVWNHYFGKLLPQNKDAAILDIGCGTGSFVWYLNQSGYSGAAGIDISEEQIQQGISLGIENIQCTDLQNYLSERTEQFDCIIARDVMEHFTKQEIFRILSLVRCALKDGGAFIMQSPNGEGILHSGILYGDFTHETAFTEKSLHQIFRNTGFTNIECYPTGPVPKGVISSIRWLLWQLIVFKTRFYKMVETGSGKGIFTQNVIAKAIKA